MKDLIKIEKLRTKVTVNQPQAYEMRDMVLGGEHTVTADSIDEMKIILTTAHRSNIAFLNNAKKRIRKQQK